jgi:phytoene dehydrogenase-like protein
MDYDVIVVGSGIAGLTASAFLTKAGYSVLLCEKENVCGGLVNSFERDGFIYEGGIRALENSGVLFPMLKQLGLELEFVKNNISVSIEDKVIGINSEESVTEYQRLLAELYPLNIGEIGNIFDQIRKIMHYMDIQYGIDNPIFLDMQKDRAYLLKVILPWLLKYSLTVRKISALNIPVEDFLKGYTQNQSLLDIITQHFFQKTPAFFALSYLKLYLDYYYPVGGVGKIIERMVTFIESHKGEIRKNTEITAIDTEKQLVIDQQGKAYSYRRLIWAADLKSFYRFIDPQKIADSAVQAAVDQRRRLLADKIGNDSIFTLFLAFDLDKSYFESRASEHFFYTPSRTGQSAAGPIPIDADRETTERWLETFFALTTYEITCPVMRDRDLAPPGKTGLIVSLLFDYRLTKAIEEKGWYEAFKSFSEACILKTLDASIYPGIRKAVIHQFSSTPLTMEKIAGNSDGAITGWSFLNNPMPAENRLPKILNAVQTPVPGVFQAGQWTYSPSGLPVSILTGKIAADRVSRELTGK